MKHSLRPISDKNHLFHMTAAHSQVSIRPCTSHEDLNRCVDLQRDIWGYEDLELVPASMFVVAIKSGGHAYGAFDGNTQIGFALAYSADRGKGRYLHSHMVGVLPRYQNQGVGRQLKLYQRQQALAQGIELIEWTFDPLETRNAYFNVARLGAIMRRYIPNCYGISSSPLHGGLPTDRLVAEWHLNSPRVESSLLNATVRRPSGYTEHITMPINIGVLKQSDPARVLDVQTAMRERFIQLFDRGYAVSAFVTGGENASYLLDPYEN